MLTPTTLRIVFFSTLSLSLFSIAGCSSSTSDAAMYAGDEEATREHMKEIELEERAHARETNASGATQNQSNSVENEERAQRMQVGE